jgi:hypothetical protein
MPKKKFNVVDEVEEVAGDGQSPGMLDRTLADMVEGSSARKTIMQQASDGSMMLHRRKLTLVGFEPENHDLPALHDIDHDQWQQIGNTLMGLDTSLQWAIGDWLAAGERARYGEAKALAEKMGKDPGLFHTWAYIARKMEFWSRDQNLTWTHHRIVVKLCDDPSEYAAWLQYAREHNLSTRQLEQAIKESKQGINKPDPDVEARSEHIAPKLKELTKAAQAFADSPLSHGMSVMRALDSLRATIERIYRKTTGEIPPAPPPSKPALPMLEPRHYQMLLQAQRASAGDLSYDIADDAEQIAVAKDLSAHEYVLHKVEKNELVVQLTEKGRAVANMINPEGE